jgi:hypothetical protein
MRVGKQHITGNSSRRNWVMHWAVLSIIFLAAPFPGLTQALLGGAIGNSQCITSGTPPPSAFVSYRDASGSAPIIYSWERSTDNFATPGIVIPLANFTTYTEPGNLITTTYYRRVATAGLVTQYSNIITIFVDGGGGTVKPVFNPQVPPLPIVCKGDLSFPVAYTTTNLPDQYSIVWSTLASAAGFTDVNADLATNNLGGTPGSITVAVSALATAGPYSGTLIARVAATGCASTPQAAFVQINPLPIAAISGSTTVCQDGTAPDITFTGSNATAPYTFTYKINGGADQTVTTSSGNSVSVSAPTGAAGPFVYSLVSVQESSTTTCTNSASGTATVTVNPLPTATVSGTATVCQDAAAPLITFTGANGTAPYAFRYQVNGGGTQNVVTTSGNSVTVAAPTGIAGAFAYSLASVQDASSTACLNIVAGTATITVNQVTTATISGTTAVCSNAASPSVTFTASNGRAPYTFIYKINGGTDQAVSTSGSNSISISAPTTTAGTFVYSLVSVQESSSTSCINPVSGSATITVNPLPAAAIGGTATVCQNAAAPSITFTGSNASAPYTFIYKINGGADQAVSTVSGNGVTVSAPTGATGTFIYSLVSVQESGATACSNAASGSVTITVKQLPTASISGTAAVCQNAAGPSVTLTGSGGTAPYTFIYKINGGANQTITTSSGNSITIAAPTSSVGTFVYALVSVQESSANACSNAAAGAATITINPVPAATVAGTVQVCQNATSPLITFTGSNATAPYTFTYKINGGANQTITTSSGNAITIASPTGTTGAFAYDLVSVQESSSASCLVALNNTATVTVNPLPAATISGTISVCQGATAPSITFTGSNSTAPYTFTYTINGGPNQTVTTTSGNSVTVAAPTTNAGTFTYALVSVKEGSSTTCTNTATGAATVIVNPLATATIGGTISVCQNATAPLITFTGSNSAAPYTFTYTINGGPNQTVTTTAGNSVTVAAPTANAGTFTYALVSVKEGSSTTCTNTATGTATVIINPLATATIGGTTAVCQNATSPLITFTGSGGAAPYTFTYKINGGVNQSVTASSGNSVSLSVTTAGPGIFTYALVSIQESSSNTCTSSVTGSAAVTINAIPVVAPITGPATVCLNNSATLADVTPAGTWTSSNNSIATVNASGLVTGVSLGPVTITIHCHQQQRLCKQFFGSNNCGGCSCNSNITASGPVTFCTGGSVVLTSSSSTGNQWYRNGVLLAAQTGSTYTAPLAGNYTVQVTMAMVVSAAHPALQQR